MVFEIKISSFF